jgi:hypothetical protein
MVKNPSTEGVVPINARHATIMEIAPTTMINFVETFTQITFNHVVND